MSSFYHIAQGHLAELSGHQAPHSGFYFRLLLNNDVVIDTELLPLFYDNLFLLFYLYTLII